MEKTGTLLAYAFGNDMVGLMLEYAIAVSRNGMFVAEAGEWETCEQGRIIVILDYSARAEETIYYWLGW